MRTKSATPDRLQADSKKVGILVPAGVYSAYEEIASDEHITVAQVIARVAIEFVDVEHYASRSRRATLTHSRQELVKKSRNRAAGK